MLLPAEGLWSVNGVTRSRAALHATRVEGTVTLSNECEYCAQDAIGRRRVIERPMAEETAQLSRFFWVVDPVRLVFCDEECRVKWHGLRRKAIWSAHGVDCSCVACMGRA